MGEDVYKIPEETGEELEGYFDERRYPYVKREGKNIFVVMVHSKPFGKEPLSSEEREEREEAKKEKKEERAKAKKQKSAVAQKKKLDFAKAKVENAKQKLEALEGED